MKYKFMIFAAWLLQSPDFRGGGGLEIDRAPMKLARRVRNHEVFTPIVLGGLCYNLIVPYYKL